MNKLIITSSNYIMPTFIIFGIVLSILVFPYSFPNYPKPSPKCVAGEAGNGQVFTLRDIIKPDPNIDYVEENILFSGGPDPNKMADFIQIRSRVPIRNEDILHVGWTFFEGGPANHNVNTGEIPQKPGYDLFYPGQAGEMDVEGALLKTSLEGLIFFRNNDPNTIKQIEGKTVYSVDVYQDLKVLNDPTKTYTTEELFYCAAGGEYFKDFHVEIPNQTISPNNEQLQLEWFVFAGGGGLWGIHCKPAIYLYPPEKMLVNVKVYPAGSLIYTDPQYDSKTGWTVQANPDGKLSTIYNQYPTTYPYLYFESKVRDEVIKKPTQGWVIKHQELTNLYQDILPKLGLNQQQTADFTEYWKKALPYSPYYFVGVIDQDNVDQIERLEITPKPDSISRVRIYFERLDAPKQVEAPHLEAKSLQFKASSFNVVEWGGMVKNDPNHPFTCSQ